MRKALCIILLSCIHLVVHAQTLEELGIDLSQLPQRTYAESIRYWFDDDIGSLANGNGLTGMHDFDASSLKEGIHVLHLQIADNEGVWGIPYSSTFMKTAIWTNTAASALRYWFNDDQSTMTNGNANGGMISVDASMLKDGVHTLHCQVIDGTGIPSRIASSIFVKAGTGMNLSAKKLLYWFDDDDTFSEVDMSGGMQTLDASMLLEGLHTLHYQIVCSDRTLTSTHSALFMRMNVAEQTAKVSKLRYWYDDNSDVQEIDVTNGLQMLDASGLLQGLHIFHYQIVDEAGAVGIPVSSLFMKMAENSYSGNDNVITKYMYWTNDMSADNVKVNIDNPASSYNLVSLLPVVKAPIRSNSFHFEMKDSKPMIFAKNDIHIRFYDSFGYWGDDSRSFLDYNVMREISDIADLQPTQTFTRPAENIIKWYKFDATAGDSIRIKSDKALTMQMFSPDGTEIMNVAGNDVKKYTGFCVPDEGTYYVALHDATEDAQSGTLDFTHIWRGDANVDMAIDVADITDVACHILGKGTGSFCEKMADINIDENVDVADIVGIDHVILYGGSRAPRKVRDNSALSASGTTMGLDVEATSDCTYNLKITLDNIAAEYTALQMDVALPEETQLAGTVKFDPVSGRMSVSKHTLMVGDNDDSCIRILSYSMQNEPIKGSEGAILNIPIEILSGEGEKVLQMSNIVLVRTDGVKVSLEDITAIIDFTTLGIDALSGDSEYTDVYDATGKKYNTMNRGVNIVRKGNGKVTKVVNK